MNSEIIGINLRFLQYQGSGQKLMVWGFGIRLKPNLLLPAATSKNAIKKCSKVT